MGILNRGNQEPSRIGEPSAVQERHDLHTVRLREIDRIKVPGTVVPLGKLAIRVQLSNSSGAAESAPTSQLTESTAEEAA